MNEVTATPIPPAPEPGIATRERLLDAAERLFSQGGFTATSVRDITSAAECNVAAVNYHFGGKENLYREVFRRRLSSIREQRIAILREFLEGGPHSLVVTVRAITSAFLDPLMAREQGSFVMDLWAREMFERRLPPELFLDEILEPTALAFVDALRGAAPKLDPRVGRLIVQSIIGQLMHAVHMRRFADIVPGKRTSSPSLNKVVDHVVRFTVAGVRGYEQEGQE